VKTIQIDLPDGRRCSVRDLDAGDMLDLIELAGSSAASDTWMRYAMTICSVRDLDDVPVLMPASKDALKDLARRIGSDGLSAVADAVHNDQTADVEKDAAKN
jgi:hypothetical protein